MVKYIYYYEGLSANICDKYGKSFRHKDRLEKHASQCIFPSMSFLNPVKNGDIPDMNSPSGSGNVSCCSLVVSTPTKSGITPSNAMKRTICYLHID